VLSARACSECAAPNQPSSQNRPLTLIYLATQIELVSQGERPFIGRSAAASRAHSNPCSEPINIGAVEDYVCETLSGSSRGHNQPSLSGHSSGERLQYCVRRQISPGNAAARKFIHTRRRSREGGGGGCLL
jgi:hypothetical protein